VGLLVLVTMVYNWWRNEVRWQDLCKWHTNVWRSRCLFPQFSVAANGTGSVKTDGV